MNSPKKASGKLVTAFLFIHRGAVHKKKPPKLKNLD
jgi:hypothetical protein